MITNERRDDCLCYLAETDENYAEAKAYMVGLSKQEKTILATETLKSTKKTQGARENEALVSTQYQEWRTNYEDAVYDYEILKNKRMSAALVVELWRSEFSARKQGVVV